MGNVLGEGCKVLLVNLWRQKSERGDLEGT